MQYSRQNTFFNEEIFCELFIEELRICKLLKKFELFGFCLLSNHFHLLIRPSEKSNLSEIMQSLKRSFSININKILEYTKFNESAKLLSRDKSDKAISRLREMQYAESDIVKVNAKNELTRRDFELNVLAKFKTQFLQKYKNNHHFPKFKWQKSFHDHVIKNEEDLKNHDNYCTYNHLRHNLPESWKYLSLNFPGLTDNLLV